MSLLFKNAAANQAYANIIKRINNIINKTSKNLNQLLDNRIVLLTDKGISSFKHSPTGTDKIIAAIQEIQHNCPSILSKLFSNQNILEQYENVINKYEIM